MTLNLTLPVTQHTDFSPRIAVIGVGGGGTNAVNNMISMGLDGVDFVVANTDAQSLVHSKAERRVQLGPHLTQGLGAGAKPEIGRAAAEEATEELAKHIDGCHMVFITAGMGGGTGTGAAPVIARMARERGVLTVGVVTKPFDFEGPKRRRSADSGIDELQQFVDTLIVIPNQNLFRVANERTTFAEAFKMADNVLYMGVRGVTDLMVNPGQVNLDFADIRTVMAEMGKAMMGTGEAEGEDRAVKAAEAAISNPLLEDTSVRGAKGVLINITGGYDMTLFEVDAAANRIRKEVAADDDANIIFGSSVDEGMNGRIRVSVVATGIDAQLVAQAPAQAKEPPLQVVAGGRGIPGRPAPAAAAPPAIGTTPGLRRPVPMNGPVPAAPGAMLRAAAVQAGAPAHAQAYAPAAPSPQAAPVAPMPHTVMQPVVSEAAESVEAPVMITPNTPMPGDQMRRAAVMPSRPVQPPAPPAPQPGTWAKLFRQATGGSSGLMRRPVDQQPAAAAPPRPEPLPQPAPQPRQAAPRAPQQEEMGGIDIPTFLRRQSN